MPPITEAAALAAFPELRRLVDLRETGRWTFLPECDADGELIEVRGVRTWPGSGSADAVRVRYTTDAAGLRCDDVGGVVWQREGMARSRQSCCVTPICGCRYGFASGTSGPTPECARHIFSFCTNRWRGI
jgi:hypothetical protein